MGIYDEYRDGISTYKFSGNRKVAASYLPQARKFAEVLQGKLDLGVNLGMEHRDTILLDKDTVMRVHLSPGVTNQTMQIEIISSAPVAKPGVVGIEIPPAPKCPELPLSRPGARLFTQMFGHDVQGLNGMNVDSFTTKELPPVQTPYVAPTLDQGKYCSSDDTDTGTGDQQWHNEATLTEPFRLFRSDLENLFVQRFMVQTDGPHIRLPHSSATVVARNAPCTVDDTATFWSTGDELRFQDLDNVVTMHPNGAFSPLGELGFECHPNSYFDVYLTEGFVNLGLIQESEVDFDSMFGQTRFAALTWIENKGVFTELELEMVFLYKSLDACDPAVGFFWGGIDGLRPWQYNAWDGSVDSFDQPVSSERYLTPQFCNVAHYNSQNTGASRGGWFLGEDRQALAWIQGDATTGLAGNPGARSGLNSRSFWFEIDADGFPSGRGHHNGPLIGDSQGGRGANDLNFR